MEPIEGPPTGPGFDAAAPPTPAKTAGGWKVWVAILLTIVIVGGAIGYVTLSGASAKPTVLMKSGTVVPIPAGDYYSGSFSIGKSAELSGSLLSKTAVVISVMDPSDYANFQSGGSIASATWTSGSVTNETFSVHLSSGNWEIVFESPTLGLPTSFLVTSDIEVTPS